MLAHKWVRSMLGPTDNVLYGILLITLLTSTYSKAFLFTPDDSQDSLMETDDLYDDTESQDSNAYDLGKNTKL